MTAAPDHAHGPALASRVVPSPIGALTVVADDHAVVAVLWPDDSLDRIRLVQPIRGVVPGEHRVVDAAAEQLSEYFAGVRTQFDLPLAPRGTPFQQAVWAALRTIPYGVTLTYGEQALLVGGASKARAVGSANGRNPLSIVVPCHRVVGASGRLGGFAGGLDAKLWLLEHERTVRDGRDRERPARAGHAPRPAGETSSRAASP
jgi:methylated-DNA-[protein]-cysteine S-methyltransferase